MAVDPIRQLGYGHSLCDAVYEELESLFGCSVNRSPVELQKDFSADPCDSLVAVNEWLIIRQRLHECCSLQTDGWIGVLTKNT